MYIHTSSLGFEIITKADEFFNQYEYPDDYQVDYENDKEWIASHKNVIDSMMRGRKPKNLASSAQVLL